MKLDPSLSASATLPFAVVSGNAHYQKWTINDVHHYEQHGHLEVSFDRIKHVPQIKYDIIRNGSYSRMRTAAQLNVRNLHLSIGSALFGGFPSPSLQLNFLAPDLKVENEIGSGNVFKTYGAYLDFESPARLYPGLPEESLRVFAASRVKIDQDWYSISLAGRYNNWYSRIVTGPEFSPVSLNDVEEVAIELHGGVRVKHRHGSAGNAVGIGYNWAGRRIPFLPPYSIMDTITVDWGIFRIFAEVKYMSRRYGSTTRLPALIVLNPGVGIEYRQARLFFTVFNAADERNETFDGYYLFPRQYAGGLRIDIHF
jgi:hypothetical protein